MKNLIVPGISLGLMISFSAITMVQPPEQEVFAFNEVTPQVLEQLNATEKQADRTVIFQDNFNDTSSYFPAFVKNATRQEYAHCVPGGYRLRKWQYSWEYQEEGSWKQAFYCVPEGKTYMEQAGRAACNLGDMRIIAQAVIPEGTKKYQIKFKQYKHDNDPLFYCLNADQTGKNGLEIGFQNQIPGTDSTSKFAFLMGDLQAGKKVAVSAPWRSWQEVFIEVNLTERHITWKIGNTLLLDEKFFTVSPGRYFGIRQCYDRGTRFDDFEITVW